MEDWEIIETVKEREEAPEVEYCIRLMGRCEVRRGADERADRNLRAAAEEAAAKHPDLVDEMFRETVLQDVEGETLVSFIGSVEVRGRAPDLDDQTEARRLALSFALRRLDDDGELAVEIFGSQDGDWRDAKADNTTVPASICNAKWETATLTYWDQGPLTEPVELEL